jgi:hypothetical protein
MQQMMNFMIGGCEPIRSITAGDIIMFLLQTPHGLFYTAGKIGTRTLLTISDSTEHTRYGGNCAVRTHARRWVELNTDRYQNVIFVIREPESRFRSGLYEIIVKQLYLRELAMHSAFEKNTECLQSHCDLFYREEFWNNIMYHAMGLGPWHDDFHKVIPGVRRWQFHVGNWLNDIFAVQQHADEFGKNTEVVHVDQLTPYLSSKGISHSRKNNSEDAAFWFKDIIPAHHLAFFSNIDSAAIKQAFNSAVDRHNHLHGSYMQRYLENEIAAYQQLCSQTVKL